MIIAGDSVGARLCAVHQAQRHGLAVTAPGLFGDSGQFGGVGTFRVDRRRFRWLAIIAVTAALVAAGCGGSSGSKSTSVGATTTGPANAAAPTKGSIKLPANVCGLLSDAVVATLLGASPTSSTETPFSGGRPKGSAVGCDWTQKTPGHQASIILHQSSSSGRDFADNTTGPGHQPVPGLGDKAMLSVVPGGEEASIEVLKGDVDILIVGTMSGSADSDAATLKQAAATILTHLGPG